MTSFRDVIGLWPSHRSMATSVGATLGSVQKWRERDSIPPSWWAAIIKSPEGRRAGVTAHKLTKLAQARPRSKLSAREVAKEVEIA